MCDHWVLHSRCPNGVRLIVAGSRTLDPTDVQILEALDEGQISVTEIVCGMAKGADLAGRRWALANGIPVKEFPAEWKSLGNSAGPIRNQKMGDYADCLIAFWDGRSGGTRHMINYMVKLRKPALVVIDGTYTHVTAPV